MKLKYFSAPYLVWMIVFILVPLLMIAYFAFFTDSGELTIKYVSDVGQYVNIFIRSIWLSLIATAICLVIAYPVAFFLSRMEKHKTGNNVDDCNAAYVDELPAENLFLDDHSRKQRHYQSPLRTYRSWTFQAYKHFRSCCSWNGV